MDRGIKPLLQFWIGGKLPPATKGFWLLRTHFKEKQARFRNFSRPGMARF